MFEGGLNPTPRSRKDFSLTRTFGDVTPVFPKELILKSVRKPREQGDNLCTAETVAEAGSDEYGKVMSADYQASLISLRQGSPVYKSGADLRKAVDTGQVFGFLEEKKSPFSWEKDGEEYVCDWSNWPKELRYEAVKHKRPAYFNIMKDTPYDPFDAVRAAIQEHKNTVMLGIPWHKAFNETKKNGIVPAPENNGFTWHAVACKGWKDIKGEPYLIIRSWSGKKGDDSFYYFSRETFNECFKLWGAAAYIYLDVAPDLFESLKQQRYTLLEIVLDLSEKLLLKIKYGLH